MQPDAQPRRHGDKPFVISRTFDAPRATVWRAWTDPAHLMRWFGPTGCTMLSCKLDLRLGGTCLYGMRMPDGGEIWGKWTFREIVPQERLVVIQCFSDPQGGVTRHPMAPTWPREMFSTTTFSERDGKTTVAIDWRVWDGTEDEHRTFDGAHDSMRQGWGGTLDRLVAYLANPTGGPS